MKMFAVGLAAALVIALASGAQGAVKSVVLVHGAFADGSGWKPVADILERDGYSVYVVQIPETSFQADVAATKYVLDRSGPCVLVGHSYGGMVITGVADQVPDRIRRLVYWNAFVPNNGESLAYMVPPPYVALFDQISAQRGDGSVVLPFPIWRESSTMAMLRRPRKPTTFLNPHPIKTFTRFR